jgi:hypothetical protein
MQSENLNMDDLTNERRKAIKESIRVIGLEELKTLCEGLFPYHDHPWREKVFAFIAENSGATFHHAVSHDRVHFIYCHARDKGFWFLPDTGMGPLQAKGLKVFKEVVESL